MIRFMLAQKGALTSRWAHCHFCSTPINSDETHVATFLRALSGPLAKYFSKHEITLPLYVQNREGN